MSARAVTICFVEPAHDALRTPESRRAFAAALRSRPGVWALLGKYPTPGTMRQAAYEIRHASNRRTAQPFAPAGSFEAVSQSLGGEYRVYVRYVGGAAA
ncbi:hypothetical protein [Streptomyces shenzhenensis]|uniref:hypothetical protein n=1 Tax=Streptomyces shenzhenensis TaxID=943815 RepID=UPI003688137E